MVSETPEICICSDCGQMTSKRPSDVLGINVKTEPQGKMSEAHYRALHLRDLSFIPVIGNLVRASELNLGGGSQAFLLLLYISSRPMWVAHIFGPKPC